VFIYNGITWFNINKQYYLTSLTSSISSLECDKRLLNNNIILKLKIYCFTASIGFWADNEGRMISNDLK